MSRVRGKLVEEHRYCCYVGVGWQLAYPASVNREDRRVLGSLNGVAVVEVHLESVTLELPGIGRVTSGAWAEHAQEVHSRREQETLGERET